ncbi:MAG: hypothetical protein JWN95_4126 [Frankiales bacterium]|nr:hypothetical protein [Frankiales bacterium]
MKKSIVLATVAAFGVGAFLYAPAAGAVTGSNGRGQPIVGDVTGDGRSDTTTLSTTPTGCLATVVVGAKRGPSVKTVLHYYSIPGLPAGRPCPDMGTRLTRKRHAPDLAVTWFSGPPASINSLFVLRNFHVVSSYQPDVDQPSYIGSQDFDGDGNGDVWLTSDQTQHFETLTKVGTALAEGPASFPLSISGANPNVIFADVTGNRGIDLIANYKVYSPDTRESGVSVINGRSGSTQVLESDASGTMTYGISVVDANGDGSPDIKVSGGANPPRVYLKNGHGHFALV